MIKSKMLQWHNINTNCLRSCGIPAAKHSNCGTQFAPYHCRGSYSILTNRTMNAASQATPVV